MDRSLTPETLGVTADLATLAVDRRILLTLLLAAGVLLLRWALVRLVRQREALLADWQRRMILRIRSATWIALAIGALWLWAPELRAFAFSIAAFIVAIVIASKEVIMGVTGGLIRSATGAFTVGDWIEVGPHSGEVVEIYATVTQLAEFDRVAFEHTGRMITVPNALFLSTPVVNHGFRKRYLYHEFVITAEPMPDAESCRQAILGSLREASATFREVAERYHTVIERRAGIALPEVAPEVRLRTSDLGKFRFEARLFCPREQAQALEQVAMRAFLDWVAGQGWRFVGVAAREA